jgi:hypothetical protein
MKVYKHPQGRHHLKIQHLEEKLEKSREKNRQYAAETKYLRRRVKDLQSSRDRWKQKNKDKRTEIKSLRRSSRLKDRVKRHHYPLWLIVLCIQLRVCAGCSYRGVCRVLAILQCSALLSCRRLPCANTIENWVTKTGHYCMGEALSSSMGRDICLIVDESIGQGNERIIAVLAVPYQKRSAGPLAYQDVRLCYLGGKSSWSGEKIKEELMAMEQKTSAKIRVILSDEDSKLLKATRLLGLPHLPDINHAMASCLRRTFEKNSQYKSLIKLISSYQLRAVNQPLSYLRPPKQRVKARFMNQKAFVEWGLSLLSKFGRLRQEERIFFAQLGEHRPMLQLLSRCIAIAEQIAKMLKNKGLCNKTLARAQQIVMDIKEKSPMEQSFLTQVKIYLEKYKTFLEQRQGVFHVSSDIIESLFGKHKYIRPSNPLTGVRQLELELPVHCLTQNDIVKIAKLALENTFITDLLHWTKANSSDNQANRRRMFFKKGK